MVNALIQISPETNKALNIIKAVNGLKDKGQAVDYLAQHTCPHCIGKTLKPEAIQRINESTAALDRGEGVTYKNAGELVKDLRTLHSAPRRDSQKETRKVYAKVAASRRHLKK